MDLHEVEELSRRDRLDVMIAQGKSEEAMMSELGYALGSIKAAKKRLYMAAKDKRVQQLAGASEPMIMAMHATMYDDIDTVSLQEEASTALRTIDSLRKLERSFHDSFNKILDRANIILDQEHITTKEWVTVTNTLSSSFKDIFNSTGTTINVAQAGSVGATDNSKNLTMFQDSKGN